MAGTLAYWFRSHYRLPPNDPRFLALTPEDIETEWHAYRMASEAASGEAVEEIEDEQYASAIEDWARGLDGSAPVEPDHTDEMELSIDDRRT